MLSDRELVLSFIVSLLAGVLSLRGQGWWAARNGPLSRQYLEAKPKLTRLSPNVNSLVRHFDSLNWTLFHLSRHVTSRLETASMGGI